MPVKITKRVAKKKSMVRRRRARVPRAPRKNFSQPEWASCTEAIRGSALQSNLIYGPNYVQLQNFKRASQVASNYQQYRITGVTWRFTPRFDTFPATSDASLAYSVPYLYYMIDRVGAIRDSVNLSQLQSMGAKPHRFDDKTIVVKYKPGVLTVTGTGQTAIPTANRYTISPWLNTMEQESANNTVISDVDHYGIWWVLDTKSLPGDGAYEYDIDIEVNFQFRKALLFTENAATNDKYGGSVLDLPKNLSQ